MFRLNKIIIVVFCISPILFAFFFGYPVSTNREAVKDGFTYTKRCFKVGELGQFLRCYNAEKAVKQGALVADLQRKTSSLFPLFDVIFFGAVIASCVVLFFL